MDKEKFKIFWKMWVASTGKSERQIAEMLAISPQNLNQKINRQSLRLDEFMDMLDRLGYEIRIEKRHS